MKRHGIDALLPSQMAEKAEAIGAKKVKMAFLPLFTLAVLAGAFIALGALFATTVATGSGELPYGVAQLLIGTVFSLGLILVVVAGAELFTGNALIVMAWAGRKVSAMALLRNWTIVYLGNLVGSVGTAFLVTVGGVHGFGGAQVGVTALDVAHRKLGYGFVQAVALGILCNALVCLAVWLSYSARSTTDRILAVIPPIAAFVAAGFEHSIANMYFVPVALLIKLQSDEQFWSQAGVSPDQYEGLTVGAFVLDNLLPVTIGNIIGGGLLVGFVYWSVYLRPRRN